MTATNSQTFVTYQIHTSESHRGTHLAQVRPPTSIPDTGETHTGTPGTGENRIGEICTGKTHTSTPGTGETRIRGDLHRQDPHRYTQHR